VFRSQVIVAKMYPQFITAVILKMHNFWGVMLCRWVIHSRIFEGTKTYRTAGICLLNKTKSQNRKPDSLECSLFLNFNLPVTILLLLYWHIFIGINFRMKSFLNYDLMRSENQHFPLLLLIYFLTCICLSARLFRVTLRTACNIRDVTPGTLTAIDTCIGYHVTRFEASRNVILHTHYVSTYVGAGCGRGRETKKKQNVSF
jgi:hypothetical protein